MDRGADRYPPLAGAEHPKVRVIPCPPGSGYGQVSAEGAMQASAPVVAFMEEHVQLLPGWADAVARALSGPWAAVCGEVTAANLDTRDTKLVELVSRQEWSPPARRGEAKVIRWQNIAYKREALLRYRDRLEHFLQAENALFAQLRADGERLYIEPDAKCTHAHDASWPEFIAATFHSSRMSAATQVRLSGLTGWRSLRMLASTLLGPVRWPLVLLRRTRTLPEPEYWTAFYRQNFGAVLRYYGTAAAGALTGMLLGPGGSAGRFLDCEINNDRLLAERQTAAPAPESAHGD